MDDQTAKMLADRMLELTQAIQASDRAAESRMDKASRWLDNLGDKIDDLRDSIEESTSGESGGTIPAPGGG